MTIQEERREGRKAERKQGSKEGRREGGKEERREGRREGRKEGRKEGRTMFAVNTCSLRPQQFHRQMHYHDRALSCIESLNYANIEKSAK